MVGGLSPRGLDACVFRRGFASLVLAGAFSVIKSFNYATTGNTVRNVPVMKALHWWLILQTYGAV